MIVGRQAALSADPPDDIAQEGFDAIGAATLSVAPQQVDQYERMARRVADAALASPDAMAQHAPCIAQARATSTCFHEIAEQLGRLFYRRPLDDDEIAELAGVGEFAASWGDSFEAGLRYQLMAMIQAPSFLYLQQQGSYDDELDAYLLDRFELASRLSFFVLGRTPSRELLDAAAAGELDDELGIRAWTTKMLSDPAAWDALEHYYDELFRLRHLADLSKNPDVFPSWSTELGDAMRQETLLLLREVVWGGADMRTMFNAPHTFVNGMLAEHYGLVGVGDGYEKTTWPGTQRRVGVLGQGSFLALQSSALRNAPTRRGKFVLTFALCQQVLPPPDDAVPLLPEDGGELLQTALEQHTSDPVCAGCHGLMDPPGFAYEHFDAIGRFRETDENGLAIDGYGELSWLGQWRDGRDLGNILAHAEQTGPCIVEGFIRGKLGHSHADAVAAIATSFAEQGFTLHALLTEVTTSRFFRYVGGDRR